MNDYEKLLEKKNYKFINKGINVEIDDLNENLFHWQKVFVQWALNKGKSCFFTQCGTGKTILQLSWANQVYINTGKNVLILAPLAVSEQTVQEGKKFGINVNIMRDIGEEKPGINIINYERLHKVDIDFFGGIVLDESSILKSFSGKIKKQIIEKFKYFDYKLACSATPSPNDYTELGNHSEFLNIMSYNEMLATFFINDTKMIHENWRLKKHATNDFWKRVCSWSIMMEKPADLGFDDGCYKLPELKIHGCIIDRNNDRDFFGMTPTPKTLTFSELRKKRKLSIEDRCLYANNLIKEKGMDNCIVWVELNDEGKLATKLIDNSVEISGSTDYDKRIKYMMDFTKNKIKYLVTKPKIAGFGMNWQNCCNCIFVGPSYSYEMFYQAVRRIYRFGQDKTVNVYLICTDAESNVIEVLNRKDKKYRNFYKNMIKYYNFNSEDVNTYDGIYNPGKEFNQPIFKGVK